MTEQIESREVSRQRPLRILALSVGLGIACGLPFISGKNGWGLLVVVLVTVTSVHVFSIFASARARNNMEAREVRKRGCLMPITSVVIGPTIAVGGGTIAHLLSPMHPLDVLPGLYSLAIVGAFAGTVVGIGVWIAFRYR